MPRKGVMLAYPIQARRIEKWGYPVYVQPKLKGRRCRAEFYDGKSVLLSSEEITIISLPHINDELNYWNPAINLDGELYAHGMTQSEINSRTARTVNMHPDYTSIHYHIFDVKVYSFTQEQRTNTLEVLKDTAIILNLPSIKFVPTYKVTDWKSLIFHQNMFVQQGYEGIIVRNPKAMYVERRTYDLLKHKPTEQDKYEIVGYEQLESKVCPECFQTPRLCIHNIPKSGLIDLPKDMLGAFICKDIRGTHFNVGSGRILTKEGRIKYWEERDTLVGKHLVVKYETLSDAKGVPVSGVVMEIV